MNSNFIITTTNSIEGCPIERYIGVICANIIIGTNVFSDFAASFTDFFGGRSDTYKKKLEIIYNEASKELKQKALSYGANAVIGFKVDFDEISGKDKSMFMVSASGTACIVELKKTSQNIVESKQSIISQSNLDDEILKKEIISCIKNGNPIKQEYMDFLISYPQIDLLDHLVNKYVEYYDCYKDSLIKIETIISAYHKNDVLKSVYQKINIQNRNVIINLIKKCNLFDAKSIYEVCNKDINIAIDLLSAKSDHYDSKEVAVMKDIYIKLSNLPDTGSIETAKSGLLGKMQEKFICINGHKNDLDVTYCRSCSVNIKGLTEEQENEIILFQQKIEALDSLLNKT